MTAFHTSAAPRTDAIQHALRYHLGELEVDAVGLGSDEYHAEAVHHPMAYAQYARGFVASYRADGNLTFLDAATAAVRRLGRLVAPTRIGAAWGLNFPWRDNDADHPYAVTTAIVGLACLDLHDVAGDTDALSLAERAARWLTLELPWTSLPTGAAPHYSPASPLVLPNVAALTAAFLARSAVATGSSLFRQGAEQAVAFVLDAQHPSGLWTYGTPRMLFAGQPGEVVDLVHSAYTIDGLVITAAALPELSPAVDLPIARGTRLLERAFVGPGGRSSERCLLVHRRRLPAKSTVLGRGEVLEPQSAESRCWGYGAALAMALRAEAVADGGADLAGALMSRVFHSHLSATNGRFPYRPDDRRFFPRHESHLFEALAVAALAPSERL